MFRKIPMMLFLCSTLLLTGLALSSQAAQAGEDMAMQQILKNGKLRVGMATGDMPPFHMKSKEGKMIGYEVDLATAMSESMGVKLEIATIEFDKLIPALEKGEIDLIMSGMTITPRRNLQIAFLGPYFISGKGLLTQKDELAKVSSPAELNKSELRLTALAGSTSEDFIKVLLPKATYMPAKTYDEAIKMITDKAVDALIADHPVCVVSVLRYPEANFQTVITPLTYDPIGVGFAPNAFHFSNWLNNYFSALEKTGLMDRLRDKWFRNGAWLEQLP